MKIKKFLNKEKNLIILSYFIYIINPYLIYNNI